MLNKNATLCVWVTQITYVILIALVIAPVVAGALFYFLMDDVVMWDDVECHLLNDIYSFDPAKGVWMTELCTHSKFVTFIAVFIDVIIIIVPAHVIVGIPLAAFAVSLAILRVKFGMGVRTALSIDLPLTANKKTKTG